MASVKHIFNFLTAPLRFLHGVVTRKQYSFKCHGTAENVFLLGTLNQLRQAEQLIRYEGLQDNYLVAIAIPKGVAATQIVLENADRSLFKFVSTRTISPRSNIFAWNRFHILKRGYQTVFRKIKPRNFFVFNFESHYALAIYCAREAGCTINLIEEGGTTYKMLPNRKLRTPFISYKRLPNKLFLSFFKKFPYYRKMQAVVDYWDTFDCLYVAFPEKLRGQMKAERIVRFNMHAPGMRDIDADKYSQNIVKKYGITSNDYIFLSSRYKVQPLLFCLSIIKILQEITRHSSGKIFIKLHPAELASSHKLFLERIAKANLPRIKLIGERDFLIEPVIRIAKPRAVLGFATATFMYSPELSPETKVVEITSWFIRELMAFPQVSTADLASCETMREQKEFYSHFPGIVSIASGEDFARTLAEPQAMEQPKFLSISVTWEDLPVLHAQGQYRAILDALPSLVLPGESPEALRQLLSLKIHLLAGEEAAKPANRTLLNEPRFTALYRAYLAAKEERYPEIVELLSPVLTEFTPEEQRLLHPGVLLAKAHRLLGSFDEASGALSASQDALLQDPLWFLEDARLAMDRGLWLKALCNFDWAYPKGVESMPPDVADEYIRVLVVLGRRGLAFSACKRVLGRGLTLSGAPHDGIPFAAILEFIALLQRENAIAESLELLRALEQREGNSSPLSTELRRQKALTFALGGLWPQVRSTLEQLPRYSISSLDCVLYWLALEEPGGRALVPVPEKTEDAVGFGESLELDAFEETDDLAESEEPWDPASQEMATRRSTSEEALDFNEQDVADSDDSDDPEETLIPAVPELSEPLVDQEAVSVFQSVAQIILPGFVFFSAAPEENYPLLLSFLDRPDVCASPCLLLLAHTGLAHLDMLTENYDEAEKWLATCPQVQKSTFLWQKTAQNIRERKQHHLLQVNIDKSDREDFGYAFSEGAKAFRVYGKTLYWLVAFAGAADDIQIKIVETASGNNTPRGTISSENLKKLFQTQKILFARYEPEEKATIWCYASQPEPGDFTGYEEWREALLLPTVASKALCNFDWAYPKGVESMPPDVADEYIRALVVLGRRGLAFSACKRVLGRGLVLSGTSHDGIPFAAILEFITLLQRENAIAESLELLRALEQREGNYSSLSTELRRQKALTFALGGLWPQVRSTLEQLPQYAISSLDCFLYWLALEEPGGRALVPVPEKAEDAVGFGEPLELDAFEETDDLAESEEPWDPASQEMATRRSASEEALDFDEQDVADLDDSDDPEETLIPADSGLSGSLVDREAVSVFQSAAQTAMPGLVFFSAAPGENYPLILSFLDRADVCASPCLLLLVHIGLAYLDMLSENYDEAEKWLATCPQVQKSTFLWQKTVRIARERKQHHLLQVNIDKSESEDFGYAFSEGAKAFRVYGKSLYWLVTFAGAADDIQIKIVETASGNNTPRGTISSENLKKLFQTQKILFARYESEEKATIWCYASQPEPGDFTGYEEWREALLLPAVASKALCNFDWAYPKGVESMPPDVADEYIRALVVLGRRGLAFSACKRVLGRGLALSGTPHDGIPFAAILEFIALLQRENAIAESLELLRALEQREGNSSALSTELRRQKALTFALGGLWPQVRSTLEQLPQYAISSLDCFLYWLALEEPGGRALVPVPEKAEDAVGFGEPLELDAFEETDDLAESEEPWDPAIQEMATRRSASEEALDLDEQDVADLDDSDDPKETLIPADSGLSGSLVDWEAVSVFQSAAQTAMPGLVFFSPASGENYPLILSFLDRADVCASPCLLLLVHIGLAYLDMLSENYDEAEKWLAACPQAQKRNLLWQKTVRIARERKQRHLLQVNIDKSESEDFGYAFSEGAKAFRVYGKSLYWLVAFAGAADDIQIKIVETASGNNTPRGTISSENLKKLFQTQKILFARYEPEEKATIWCYASQPEPGDFTGYEEWRDTFLRASITPEGQIHMRGIGVPYRRSAAKPLLFTSKRMKKGF